MARSIRQSLWITGLFALIGGMTSGPEARPDDRQPADAPTAGLTPGPRLIMIGSYGPWLFEKVLGDGPARLELWWSPRKNLRQRVIAKALCQ